MRIGCFSLLAALLLMMILPWIFVGVMEAAFLKLHVSPRAAAFIVAGILIGSLINIPVKRIERSERVPVDPWAVYGLGGLWPSNRWARAVTIVAVNVGGCLIPAALAAYEALLLARAGVLGALAGAVLLNVAVCYRLARPVPGVGILMPGLIPPVIAALSALLLAPEQATPVAFVAGVLGPLVGADLLHLREIGHLQTGMMSIGGAGTFDGILLSGIVALYLS